jgi:galactonate dehydratase
MKITDIHCRVMGITASDQVTARRNWVFVFIETDVGITGVGEATTEWHELAVVTMVNEHFRPALLGQDPTQVEKLWQLMFRRYWWRGGVVETSAISGIDQALWDITGKAYKLPVYKLLGGGVRERVRLYARGDLGLANVVDEARAAMTEGFDAFKFGPGALIKPFDEARQVEIAITEFHKLREAVGASVDLMIDCAGLFSRPAAADLISGLRPLHMLFVEEPVNCDPPTSLLELRRAFPDVRIAAGERQCTRWAFREWLDKGAVDVIQADISHTGGISELLKIAHAAEVHDVQMAPHGPYGPVALAAAAHACAATANFLILEHGRFRPWFNDVQRFGPTICQGYVELDDRPGLGVELNLSMVERFPYRPLELR